MKNKNIKQPSFNAHSMQFQRTLYALFPCKINFPKAYKKRWKTCLKLFYIEHRVHGYFLDAGTVLYIAESLRYLRIKHPSFNAHSLQCKTTLYIFFSRKIKHLKTYLKLFYIEHIVHGYFLGAGTELYILGSLGYLRIKHPSLNAHSLQCKHTLYAFFPCRI